MKPPLSSTCVQALGCLFSVALAALPATAFEIEYAHDRPAALKACDDLLYRGDVSGSGECYINLVDDNDDVRIKADASAALGELQAANTYFQTAVDLYPDDIQLRTRWGELFYSSHQDNEAVKLFQEAIAMDDSYTPALRGLARVAAEGFSVQAKEIVDGILDIDGNDIEAHIMLARLQLEDGAIDDGEASLQIALQAAESNGTTPLEIYAYLAAVDLLRDVTESEWTKKALAINPRYGQAYAIPAHFYVITRRYREAVELLRQAVEIEPQLYAAHAELGINLLRDNHVVEATRHMQTAYAGDPFSTETVNTLRLLDSLDNFTFKGHGELEVDGTLVPSVFLRLHKDETDILESYALDLINSSIEQFSQRYDFQLREPVIVELYPDHDDFAVRTAGLPGIGLLGVTFGYLVAMDSPTGRPRGEFHWGTTLWHEMAHIFTLEATNHLVPRWFSEGVSVHEEWSTGPLPGRHISLSFFEALAADQLLPIAQLDRGFIRPTYPAQIIVSYMQAGLICNYISATFGQERLAAMLHAFTEGLDTPAALSVATGLSAAAFDTQFAEYLDMEFGEVVAQFETWRQRQEAMLNAYRGGDWSASIDAADEAIGMFPQYVDEGSPYIIKAQALRELDQRDAARETLETYFERGGFAPDALKLLAGWQLDAGNTVESANALQALTLVAPIDESLHLDLGDRLRELGRNQEALSAYQILMAMEPHDMASVHFRLAKVFLDLDQAERSREHLLYALEIAPHFREAQDMLLETLR